MSVGAMHVHLARSGVYHPNQFRADVEELFHFRLDIVRPIAWRHNLDREIRKDSQIPVGLIFGVGKPVQANPRRIRPSQLVWIFRKALITSALGEEPAKLLRAVVIEKPV